MRPILIICLVCACGLTLAQQSEREDGGSSYKHSIGLNATGLLQNVFNTDDSRRVLPYLFTYDLELDRMGLRLGIGPEYRTSTEVHEGFTDSRKETTLKLDARVGVGFRLFDENRWRITAGVDVIGGYDLFKTTDDTGFDKVTREVETERIGAGPFLQIAFRVSDRVSIRTESAVYASKFTTRETELFENFPDFNNELSKTTGTTLDTFLPTSIFVHLHF